MSENMHGRPAPFDEYINYSLDMSGVDGISFETVALAMREIMHNAAFDDGDLDRLQATLRDCLSVEIIHHLIQRDPGVTDIDPELVDRMVMTSMLLAFSSYNRLTEQFGFEAPALAQSRDDVQRLWRTLRAASGWINKAAAEGDTVARGMADEINNALEEIAPPNWFNNTRTLPK